MLKERLIKLASELCDVKNHKMFEYDCAKLVDYLVHNNIDILSDTIIMRIEDYLDQYGDKAPGKNYILFDHEGISYSFHEINCGAFISYT